MTILGLKSFFKEYIDDVKESSRYNDSVKKLKKSMGIGFMENFNYDSDMKYLIVQRPSYSIWAMGSLLAGNRSNIKEFGSTYKIYDKSRKLKYMSDYDISLIFDKESFTLYDSEKKKIGKVKEYLLSVGFPLFEKEVKKCSVFLQDDILCRLKKYESFGDTYFETLEGKISIKNQKSDENKFIIKIGNKIIGTIYSIPLKLKDGLVDRYLIEYKAVENETILALVSLALDIIDA